MTPFEKYKPKNKPEPESRVAIDKNGRFCLNNVAYEDHFKDYPEIIFYFDHKEGKIGIKPTRNPTKNDYSFQLQAAQGGLFAVIDGRTFLESYRIEFQEYTRSYVARWNDKEGLLEFTLEPARLQNVKRTGGYKHRYQDRK